MIRRGPNRAQVVAEENYVLPLTSPNEPPHRAVHLVVDLVFAVLDRALAGRRRRILRSAPSGPSAAVTCSLLLFGLVVLHGSVPPNGAPKLAVSGTARDAARLNVWRYFLQEWEEVGWYGGIGKG